MGPFSRRTWGVLCGLIVLALATWALWPDDGQVPRSAGESSTPDALTSTPERDPFANPFELPEGQHDFADAGVRPLFGVVVDTSGKPVAGAEVLVLAPTSSLDTVTCPVCEAPVIECGDSSTARWMAEGVAQGRLKPHSLGSTVTDDLGRFRFESVPNVELEVHAQSPAGLGGMALAGDEEVDPGAPLEIEAAPVEPLVLQVVDGQPWDDSEAHPVPNARLLLIANDTHVSREVMADAQGRAVVKGFYAPAGVIAIVEAPGHLSSLQPLYGSEGETQVHLLPSRALKVTTTSGGKPIDATLTLDGQVHPRSLKTVHGELLIDSLGADFVSISAATDKLASAPVEVDLTGESPPGEVNIELRPSVRLLVTVIDEQGEPVPFANATVTSHEQDASGSSELGALIILGPLGEAAFTLDVEAPGYRRVSREIDPVSGDNPVEVVLQLGMKISGQVVDASGAPAPHGSVNAVSIEGEGGGAVVDENGRFELLVGGPGEYTLTALANNASAVAKIEAPAQNVVLKLLPTAELRVTVTENGKPPPRTLISVETKSLPPHGRVRIAEHTDEDGVAYFNGLHPGPVTVSARYGSAHSLSVALEAGKITETRLELPPTVTMAGILVDDQGLPVQGAQVVSAPSGGAAVSSADGSFKLENLEQGVEYKIWAAGELGIVEPPVVATAGKDRSVRLVMKRHPQVKGRVVDGNGSPVRRFIVNGVSFDGVDGTFEIPVSLDEDEVGIDVTAEQFTAKYFSVRPKKAAKAREALDVGDLVLAPIRQVRGVVVDATGKPVVGAAVDVSGDLATTGADGQFTLKLSFETDEGTQISAHRGQARGSAPLRLEGENLIRLAAPVRVTGHLLAADGRPMPGVVTMTSNETAEAVRAEANGAGEFEAKLAEGRWMFSSRGSSALRAVDVRGPATDVVLGGAQGACAATVEVQGELEGVLFLVPVNQSFDPNDPGAASGAQVVHLELDENGRFEAKGLACGPHVAVLFWPSGTEQKRVDLGSHTALRFVEPKAPVAMPNPAAGDPAQLPQ